MDFRNEQLQMRKNILSLPKKNQIYLQNLFNHPQRGLVVNKLFFVMKRAFSAVFLLNIVYMSEKCCTFVPVFSGLVKQNGRSNRKI